MASFSFSKSISKEAFAINSSLKLFFKWIVKSKVVFKSFTSMFADFKIEPSKAIEPVSVTSQFVRIFLFINPSEIGLEQSV